MTSTRPPGNDGARLPDLPAKHGVLDQQAIRDIARDMRLGSWDIALRCLTTSSERNLFPMLKSLSTVKQLANLPAFIGGLATALVRPRPNSVLGSNPILTRLARDHAMERESAGFTTREIVQEFLLLRRVLWQFIRARSSTLDTNAVLRLEDQLNSILDEVVTECTVAYFERATHALHELSRRDGLTGLLNHQAFHNRLDAEIDRCRRYGHELQVIYFDLCDFKQINDTWGHAVGDTTLQTVAELVLDSVRETDFAGRLGGDEFVIGLVESDSAAAKLLLDRLHARVSQKAAERKVPPMTALSAGVAGFPREADTPQDLLVLADRRQYDDKRTRKAGRS